jgi:hypothetical protein
MMPMSQILLNGIDTKRHFGRESSKFAEKRGYEFYWRPAGSIRRSEGRSVGAHSQQAIVSP